MFTDQKISFIGAGTMGEAMIRGLLGQEIVHPDQIIAADPWDRRTELLAKRYQIHTTQDNREAAEQGQIVILSIKPQSIPYVLPEIRGHLRRQDLLLSIIAGAPIRKLADGAAHASVVRAMPNTPAQIGMGITVWTATREVSEDHKEQARAILGSLGDEIYVQQESY
ncbi:MAG: NAD(P)-binding domain-containing protein, partial [Candidatus Promineifilaceae bacterium]|nr:NAD(P)-binding domain-containing protein [Candidatus Promineifilaceae bacterium]